MDIREVGLGTARASRSSQRGKGLVGDELGGSSTEWGELHYRRLAHVESSAASAKLPINAVFSVILVVATTLIPKSCSGPGAAGSLVMYDRPRPSPFES